MKICKKSKLLAILLAAVMCLSLVPGTARAASPATVKVIVAVDTYDGWKVIYPATGNPVDTEVSVSYSGANLTALDVVSFIDPTVTSSNLTSNRPTTFLTYSRNTDGYGNWSARKLSGTAYTNITNFTSTTFADSGDSIIIYLPFSSNPSTTPTWETLEPLIANPAPVKTPQQRLDAVIAAIGNFNTYNTTGNADADNVKSNLTGLPSYYEGSSSSFSGFTISWATSDRLTAYVGSSGGTVTMFRPGLNQPDKEVTLTATVKRGSAGYYDPAKYPSDFESATVAITINVIAVTQTEYDADPARDTNIAIVQYCNDNITLGTVFQSSPAVPIDIDNVKSDIQLIDPYNVYDTAGGTGAANRPDNMMSINWVSGNPAVISVNSMRANVYRPEPGEPDETVTLTVYFRKGFVTGSKSFTITVKAVSQGDIDAVNAELDAVAAALTWERIANYSTNSGPNRNTTADAVRFNMQYYYRATGYPGAITFGTTNSGAGIMITQTSSDTSVVNNYFQVQNRASMTTDKNVTLTFTLTSQVLPGYVTTRTVSIPIVVRKVNNSADVASIIGSPIGDMIFSQATKSYAVTVPALADSESVTITTAESGCLITVNDGTSDIASGRGTLTFIAPFDTQLSISTLALDGSLAATDTYTLSFTKATATAKDTQIGDLLTHLAEDVFENTAEDWSAVDMSAYGAAADVNGKSVVENARAAYIGSVATDHERAAIALTALGVKANAFYGGDTGNLEGQTLDLISKFAINSAYASSVSEAAFGLIALDSGNYVSTYMGDSGPADARDDYVAYLLSHKAGDGWAYSGTTPDVDLTAMVITALAPYAGTTVVQTAIDTTINWLSGQQQSDGSFGNANSTAMVVIALSALGKNADTDAQFIKSGKSALDGLLSFVTSDLRFGYTNNATANAMATEQGFRALVSYRGYVFANAAYSIYKFAAPTLDGSTLTGEEGSTVNPVDPDTIPKHITVRAENLSNGTTVLPPTVVSLTGNHLEALEAAVTAIGKIPANEINAAGGYVSSLLGLTAGSQTGWMYALNGVAPSTMLSETRVAEGDELVLFFLNWFESAVLARFDKSAATITAGGSVTLTLTGYTPDMNTLAPGIYTVLPGATVYAVDASGAAVSGVTGTTDANGSVTLTFPAAGSYTIRAKQAGTYNETKLVSPLCAVTVNSQPSEPPVSSNVTVTLRVTGADSAVILGTVSVTVPSGSSVFDVLKSALDGRNIAFTYTGSGATAYVTSINGLKQFDYGTDSGWMYSVNGVYPKVSCGETVVKNSDRIEWAYTKDAGKDIGAGDAVTGGDSGSSGGSGESGNGGTDTETPWVNPFKDVKSGDWYFSAVQYVAERGLMVGTGDGEFSPNATLTRGTLITVIARAAGVDTTGGETWWSVAREWGMANGITDGANMEAPVTREQIVSMLYRYARFKDLSIESAADLAAFTDAGEISGYAIEAMRWAVGNKIMFGRTATTLVPQGTATRAEAAALVMRFLNNIK